jgi:DNA mismatch repair protein MutL
MGKIKVLPERVANKIAAGEVVERPASVVKELVENALDAGARAISITIGHGGKSLVRVKDDGCGMDREDAQACLQRHATSKLSDADEIETIATLGFRGEALPSIAAVARLCLTTRTHGDETATLVKAAGSVIESVSSCVADEGTSIEITDLFFNTPARRKFLKSDVAEYSAILDVFQTLCLARSDVTFSLARQASPAAAYPACPNLLQRLIQLYGPEFAEKLRPLAVAQHELRVTGYIGIPDHTRVNRTGQKFFVNGRPINSPYLSSALGRAYEEFVPQKRFPVAVLFLDIDRPLVDVNVHPAKREIRLRNEHFFYDVLVKAIQKELRAHGFSALSRPEAPTMPGVHTHAYPAAGQLPLPVLKESAAAWKTVPQPEPLLVAHDARDPLQAHNESPAENLLEAGAPLGCISILGQVLETYIVAEAEDGCLILDQHAAHERVLYEEILKRLIREQSPSQHVIFPLNLHLELQEIPVMEAYQEDFRKVGFGLNPLGKGTFSVDAVPVFLTDGDVLQTIRDSLHELLERPEPRSYELRQQALAATLACKVRAVKAGRSLQVQEMEHLIRRLAATDNPHVCPHGRPTFFLLTRQELEKRFKRT